MHAYPVFILPVTVSRQLGSFNSMTFIDVLIFHKFCLVDLL